MPNNSKVSTVFKFNTPLLTSSSTCKTNPLTFNAIYLQLPGLVIIGNYCSRWRTNDGLIKLCITHYIIIYYKKNAFCIILYLLFVWFDYLIWTVSNGIYKDSDYMMSNCYILMIAQVFRYCFTHWGTLWMLPSNTSVIEWYPYIQDCECVIYLYNFHMFMLFFVLVRTKEDYFLL